MAVKDISGLTTGLRVEIVIVVFCFGFEFGTVSIIRVIPSTMPTMLLFWPHNIFSRAI